MQFFEKINMEYKIVLGFMLTLLNLSSAEPIHFNDCGSTGIVKSVSLSPCSSQPCVLKYNTNVELKMDFVTKMDTQELTAIMIGIIAGSPFPQPLPDPNACDCGVKCPVKNGDENVFTQSIYIEYDFPMGNITTQVELKDDKGASVTCIQFPVTISD